MFCRVSIALTGDISLLIYPPLNNFQHFRTLPHLQHFPHHHTHSLTFPLSILPHSHTTTLPHHLPEPEDGPPSSTQQHSSAFACMCMCVYICVCVYVHVVYVCIYVCVSKSKDLNKQKSRGVCASLTKNLASFTTACLSCVWVGVWYEGAKVSITVLRLLT